MAMIFPMIVPRSMVVMLEPVLERHMGQFSIIAHPSTAFRLTVKTTSKDGIDVVDDELLCNAWRASRQVLKQLHVGDLAMVLDK
jgi:hypothetical protein